ncbi:MAG: DciA family protein [Bryobacteraceae bacterium]
MERAGRVLRRSSAGAYVTTEEIAVAAWPAAAGKIIARHTDAKALVNGSLLVDVEDRLWQRQLRGLSGQILAKLEQVAGSGIVRGIDFRVAAVRKRPGREIRPVRDESDRIEDPVMRNLYVASRRKSSA